MHYRVYKHRIKIDGTDFETFGITAEDPDEGIKADFPDLSSDLGAVKKLVNLMIEEKPEFVHLNDIIEDFILFPDS